MEVAKDMPDKERGEITGGGRTTSPDLARTPAAANGGLLQAVFDLVAAGMYVFDLDGTVQLANPGAHSLLRCEPGTLAGTSAHDAFHYIDSTGHRRPAATCPIIGVARDGVDASSDNDVFVRRDGSLLPVAWSAAPIIDDGQSIGGVVVFYDITMRVAQDLRHDVELAEARRAGEAARAQASRVGFLSDATHALVSTLDVDEALARLARILVPRFADWCVIDLLDDGRIRRVAVAHREPQRVIDEGVSTTMDVALPERSDALLARVLGGERSGILDVFPASADMPTEMERQQFALFERLGASHAVVVGLRARSGTIGAVTLVRSGEQPFDPSERALAEDIALRSAIAVDNARLFTDTRSTAEALQHSLLPRLSSSAAVTIRAAYVPAGQGAEIGGDWYDAYPLQPDVTAVALGDVAGHDLLAATRMGDIRNLLRAASLEHEDPAEVLAALDRSMDHFTPDTTATAVYGQIDTRTPGAARFAWSNAGHPAPLLLLPDGTGRFLDHEGDPLLGTAAALTRRTHVETVPPGAMILLYSDGLVEDRVTGLEPGMTHLLEVAGQLARLGAGPLSERLVLRLGRDTGDDIAILVVAVPAPI